MVGMVYHFGETRRRTHGILKEFGSIPSVLCLFSDSNGILKQLKVKFNQCWENSQNNFRAIELTTQSFVSR